MGIPYLRRKKNMSNIVLTGNDGESSDMQLRNIFTRATQLESLICWYDAQFLESLKPLQNLRRLTIHEVQYDAGVENIISRHLEPLISLSQLNIGCKDNCIKVLKKICESSANATLRRNLTRLVLRMPCDLESIKKIKDFENLQVLSMVQISLAKIPSNVMCGFPKRLREIKIDGLTISCDGLFTLIHDLLHLEVLDVGEGDIFEDNNIYCGLHGHKVASLIEVELKLKHANRSKLTIHYSRPLLQFPLPYDTNSLQIEHYNKEASCDGEY